MTKYVVLGAGDSVLCMLFELLHQLHNEAMTIPVVQNVEPPEIRLAYETALVKGKEINAREWQPASDQQYLIGVVNPRLKKRVLSYFNDEFNLSPDHFPSIVSSKDLVASTTTLESGVIVNPCSTIAGHSQIDSHVFINRSVSIGHHTTVGECSSINPSVTICGHCEIGKETTIGAGATILNNVSVGSNSVIGAGSVVTKDIPDNVVAYGSPAKVIRELE